MARLLLVHHSPTPTLRDLTDAVLAGTRDEAVTGVEVVERAALEASAEDVLAADGYLLVTPANFGYMSGALKHFFDSLFLQVGGALGEDGSAVGSSGGRRPFGLAVHGRYDTTGAVRSVLAITGALPWQQAAPVLEVLGDPDEEARAAAYELGGTLAALLSS
jgi:NAD(P)H-dependent FMN reductase